MFRFILVCAFLAALVWWPTWFPNFVWGTVPRAAATVTDTAVRTYAATEIPLPLLVIAVLAVLGVLMAAGVRFK